MGPLVTREHRDRVASYLEDAALGGAEVVVDGREQSFAGDGFFLGPSLVDSVRPGTQGVRRRDLRAGALGAFASRRTRTRCAWSTTTPTATAWPSSPATAARRAASSSRCRPAWSGVNVAIPVPVAYYSFGGWKSSLFGDTHMYGPDGIHFYTRAKVVTSRWPDPSTSTIDLGFPQNR